MRKAKITVPAVSTNLGPGIESLALALGMHVTATLIERSDTRLVIESGGEGHALLPPDCEHPVMYAAVRVFQRLEDAPLGLRVNVRSAIPLQVGLGAEAAMTVAGLVGANSLMGTPLSRDELIAMGMEIIGRPDGVIAAMLGGLTISAADDGRALYRRIEMAAPPKVVVVVPEILDYDSAQPARSKTVALTDAIYNLGRAPLVTEALRAGDAGLLVQALDDRLLRPSFSKAITGFDAAVAAARTMGADGVTISGEGPALLIFARFNHRRIAAAVEAAFGRHGVSARSWTLPVDTQGVVVTAAETLPG